MGQGLLGEVEWKTWYTEQSPALPGGQRRYGPIQTTRGGKQGRTPLEALDSGSWSQQERKDPLADGATRHFSIQLVLFWRFSLSFPLIIDMITPPPQLTHICIAYHKFWR